MISSAAVGTSGATFAYRPFGDVVLWLGHTPGITGALLTKQMGVTRRPPDHPVSWLDKSVQMSQS